MPIIRIGKEQKEIFNHLTKKYRQHKRVNWQKLWNDPARKLLPLHYTLPTLLRYYSRGKIRNPATNIRASLRWRQKYPDKFRENQHRQAVKHRDQKNAFLLKLLPLRKTQL